MAIRVSLRAMTSLGQLVSNHRWESGRWDNAPNPEHVEFAAFIKVVVDNKDMGRCGLRFINLPQIDFDCIEEDEVPRMIYVGDMAKMVLMNLPELWTPPDVEK